MELTLGPVLFEWRREDVLRFYDEVADMDVDRVYVGEVVCTKKRGLLLKDIGAIAEKLTRSGKKVVLSSLAVVSNEEELDYVREIVKLPYPVEANDMSVFNIATKGKEVFAGPHITSYNVPSIEFLKDAGALRVTFPVEMSRDSVAHCLKHTGVCGEVFAHGKVPLAFSWRCYTSRAFNLSKTECKRHCAQYPDGLELKTMDNEPVFAINGTSILSARVYTLIEFIDDLLAIGAGALRVSPQFRDTAKVVEIFRKRMRGALDADGAVSELKSIYPQGLCNGWYSGGAGKDYRSAQELKEAFF